MRRDLLMEPGCVAEVLCRNGTVNPVQGGELTEYVLAPPLRYEDRRFMAFGFVPDLILRSRCKRDFEPPQGRWLAEALPAIRVWLADLPRDCPVNGQGIAARLEAGEGGRTGSCSVFRFREYGHEGVPRVLGALRGRRTGVPQGMRFPGASRL